MAVKKKKIDYTIWVLGAAAVGLLGYVFKDDIKKLFEPKDDPNPDPDPNIIIPPITPTIITNGGGNSTTTTPGLNPIGTPKDNLNFNVNLRKGYRGQEVAKLQQILNRIAKISGKAKLTEDGIFGEGTRARLAQMFGNIDNINLYKMYVALFAYYAADKAKTPNKWFDRYTAYLDDPSFYKDGRELYFKNNPTI